MTATTKPFFGVTIHTQTGEEVKIHDVDCRHYINAKQVRGLTPEEAVAWLRDKPAIAQCSQCIKRPADAMPDNEMTPDVVDHIISPARDLQRALRGEKVKAVCGQVITHGTRRGMPICRKCFDKQFR